MTDSQKSYYNHFRQELRKVTNFAERNNNDHYKLYGMSKYHAFFRAGMFIQDSIEEAVYDEEIDLPVSEIDNFVSKILYSGQEYSLNIYSSTKYGFFERQSKKKQLKKFAILFLDREIEKLQKESISNHKVVSNEEIKVLIWQATKIIRVVYKYTPLKLQLELTNNDVDRLIIQVDAKTTKKHIN